MMEAINTEVKKEYLKKAESYKKICYWVKQALLNTQQTAKEKAEPENINVFWSSIDEMIYSLPDNIESKEELNNIYMWLRENHQEFINQDLSEGILLSLEGSRLVDKE